MRIYNTLTRKKEEFEPIEAGKERWYAGGIRVRGGGPKAKAFRRSI